jgi:hypothetical protein
MSGEFRFIVSTKGWDMQTLVRALYLSSDERVASRLQGQMRSRADTGFLWSCRDPALFDEAGEYAHHPLIVVDGASLGARVVETVQRIRWLGFVGCVVVVNFGKSELERVLAFEAGADVVDYGEVPMPELARYVDGMSCRSRWQPHVDARAPSRAGAPA